MLQELIGVGDYGGVKLLTLIARQSSHCEDGWTTSSDEPLGLTGFSESIPIGHLRRSVEPAVETGHWGFSRVVASAHGMGAFDSQFAGTTS